MLFCGTEVIRDLKGSEVSAWSRRLSRLVLRDLSAWRIAIVNVWNVNWLSHDLDKLYRRAMNRDAIAEVDGRCSHRMFVISAILLISSRLIATC